MSFDWLLRSCFISWSRYFLIIARLTALPWRFNCYAKNGNGSLSAAIIAISTFSILSLLSSPSMGFTADIYLRYPQMQFSQMTLKYCIVISEICFCSVALQSGSRWIELVGMLRATRAAKRSRKNSFNAFNLDSFFVYIPFFISLSPGLCFNINIGFSSWLYSRNVLAGWLAGPERQDFWILIGEFPYPKKPREGKAI